MSLSNGFMFVMKAMSAIEGADAHRSSKWSNTLEGMTSRNFLYERHGDMVVCSRPTFPWTHLVDDMMELSSRHRGIIFEVDPGDNSYKSRFLNGEGETVLPEVKWPEFSEEFKSVGYGPWMKWSPIQGATTRPPFGGCKVQVKLRDGTITDSHGIAGSDLSWIHHRAGHPQSGSEIVSYRVLSTKEG